MGPSSSWPMVQGDFGDFFPEVYGFEADGGSCFAVGSSAAGCCAVDGLLELVEVGVYVNIGSGAVVILDGGLVGAGELMQEVKGVSSHWLESSVGGLVPDF